MNGNFIFQQSYWFLGLCLIIGVLYAWALYTKAKGFSKIWNRALATLRALLVAFICFLLLNPLLRSEFSRTLKPILVLGIDNSASLNEIGVEALTNLQANLKTLKDEIASGTYEVFIRQLNGLESPIDSIEFDEKRTDVGLFFNQIKEEFDGRNLQKVILVSDGIVNTGLSPLAYQYPFMIDAIGIGDTTVKRDIAIKDLTANKLAYLGNSFPVQVAISAKLFNGARTTVRIKHEELSIAEEIISFSGDDDFKTINFQLNADQIGKQRYTVELLPLAGEYSRRNNYRELIIDIVDGKEKILLVALAAHPDVKALRGIIEKNPLFELEVKILQTDQASEILDSEFDILILHQLPERNGVGDNITSNLLARMKPSFFILGAETDLSRFNGMQEVLGISAQTGKMDKVTGANNIEFRRFFNDDSYANIIENLPPLNAAFGQYRAFPGSDVILYQKVGTILTDRPLLVVNTNANRKAAVFAAEGLWQWRMEEYFLNHSHDAVDNYILKTLQLISVKEDKEKLRIYTTQDEIDIDESVVFQTEAYDDLYERIYDVSVELVINRGRAFQKTFDFDVSQDRNTFEISGLDPGVYTYEAKGIVLGKTQQDKGQFVIKDKDIEFLNTQADFNFLRTLADKNGGDFYQTHEIGDLSNRLLEEDLPSRLIHTEKLREIINLQWILPLLLLLITLEWVTRKYLGSY